MKNIFVITILTILLVSLCSAFSYASPSLIAFATDASDNSVITFSSKQNEQNELVLQANLVKNTGISAMVLELSYDKKAMTLSNVVFGQALSSLNPITTNTDTDAGYSITPFKFNYSGQNNDSSTGVLFTLTFKISKDVKDGKYLVSLKYAKNKDVNYIDSNRELKTKNLFIDNAEVEIKNNSVVQVTAVSDDTQSPVLWIIIICVSLVIIACGVFVAIRYYKKQRNWKRI